ncbi:MAG TPA: hypothetical protein VKT82_23340 [Ktedonobacterales bacterium]|nr:hypothetical protein [Ktedonobacterales bacterium]
MTECLRRVLAQIKQLDADSWDGIAATIEVKFAEITEASWKELFADLYAYAFFDGLVAQAEAAEANGTLLDLDDLLKTVI